MQTDPNPNARDLLPPVFSRPVMLFWTGILPQILLLLLNLHSYGLAEGEMDIRQHTAAYQLLGMQTLLLGTVTVIALALSRARKAVGLLHCIPLLLLHIAYLWTATWQIGERLIPASVGVWMLREETVMYHQFALVMPMVFYAALRLACFPSRGRSAWDAGASGLLLIFVPAFWYIIARAMVSLHGLPEFLLVVLVVLSTILMTCAALRLFGIAYRVVQRQGELGTKLLLVIAGLILPVAGLLLNIHIPFPVDFQNYTVYGLAVINGLVLLPDPSRNTAGGQLAWLAQCATFPFTLYFFVVFLPFLPLALLAVIAMGAGILMLAPTILFFMHVQRLADGFRGAWSARRVPVRLAAGIGAALLLPAWFTGSALLDRQGIHAAIAHAYSPDFGRERFSGRVSAVERGLENLRRFKAGLQLPFISGYYNWIVFDGLVLPDEKMDHLQRVFTGHDFKPLRNHAMGGQIFGGRRNTFRRTPRLGTPPPATAVLDELTVTTRDEGDCAIKTVEVRMRNPGANGAEFATGIEVPEGVLVSGFWLDVNGEKVPGRLFEKKTALWVYRMIRDMTRRDPGILAYKDARQLEFRVFPFAAGEARTAWIEFLYPAVQPGRILFGGRSIGLEGDEASSHLVVTHVPGQGVQVQVPEQAARQWPAVTRKPYFHFIVDGSVSNEWTREAIAKQCREVLGLYPAITDCMVSIANYESHMLTPQPVSGSDLEKALPGRLPQFHGGFCRDRAIKKVLQDHGHAFTAESVSAPRVPLVVVLSKKGGLEIKDAQLAPFDRYVPEVPGFASYRDGRLEWQAWNTGVVLAESVAVRLEPVALIRVGDELAAVRQRGASCLRFADAEEARVEVHDPATGRWTSADPMTKAIRHERYERGVDAWLQQEALWRNPSLGEEGLRKLVGESKGSGVLVPATSFIVVENSAQWKMLERKEGQKLRNAEALEFMETPEPGVWLLLPGMAGWLYWRSRRRALTGKGERT